MNFPVFKDSSTHNILSTLLEPPILEDFNFSINRHLFFYATYLITSPEINFEENKDNIAAIAMQIYNLAIEEGQYFEAISISERMQSMFYHSSTKNLDLYSFIWDDIVENHDELYELSVKELTEKRGFNEEEITQNLISNILSLHVYYSNKIRESKTEDIRNYNENFNEFILFLSGFFFIFRDLIGGDEKYSKYLVLWNIITDNGKRKETFEDPDITPERVSELVQLSFGLKVRFLEKLLGYVSRLKSKVKNS